MGPIKMAQQIQPGKKQIFYLLHSIIQKKIPYGPDGEVTL